MASKRRVLCLEPVRERWRLETLDADDLDRDPRADYTLLYGEALGQYLLRRDPESMVVARGPLVFLSGCKATVGYLSPLTGVPHYSFVGGRAAAELLNLGLDAIWLTGPEVSGEGRPPIVMVEGRAPNVAVRFVPADDLPRPQRTAHYWLRYRLLGDAPGRGSVFCVGEGAWLGYRAANLAVEAIYHAGRGGAGAAFCRRAAAMVLCGEPLDAESFFAPEERAYARNPNAEIAELLERHCARLAGDVGGTIVKIEATGSGRDEPPTLPTDNARRLGGPLADLGSPQFLRATRHGHTGCQWCRVDCRHYHWVEVDYTSDGRDLYLDDFEPTYALLAMLGLQPRDDSLRARRELVADAHRALIVPVEQLGCDAIDTGLGLAALLEGMERGLIPQRDVPEALWSGARSDDRGFERLEVVSRAVAMLRSGEAHEFPALRAVGDGPQALAEHYPAMEAVVFTGGKGTLGNAGHCNALWTFMMPFGRFFGHYVGQFYKIERELPPSGSGEAAYRDLFAEVVRLLLQQECYWLLGNCLSQCAFTFVIYSQDGAGLRLRDDGLLPRMLRHYGFHSDNTELEWFAQAFWAQSMVLKCAHGWQPPTAAEMPPRVFEALSGALQRPPAELRDLMDLLIAEWRRQAGALLGKFGYDVPW